MAQLNFGGTVENVVIRDEFPLEKAREVLKNETIAVIGYGVQGPGQALNLRDNGFNVIVGQRQGKTYDKAVADGWVPGETLFGIEEACEKGTIIMCLLSDAAVMSVWPTIKPYLTAGKALYFSHGFAITWSDRTGVVPPADIDVIMVAPKGSGTSLRTMFLEGRGLNSSYAIYQDATGNAMDRTIALGIGIGSGYLFETTFIREATSDLTGERGSLMGAIQGLLLAQYEVLRENGHTPSEAFNETVEELTQSLMPLFAKNAGKSLEEVAAVAQKFADNMATIAVAAKGATHPATDMVIAQIEEGKMEIGMGQHGEGGGGLTEMKTADETAAIMIDALLRDLDIKKGEKLLVIVNGVGATTLMEQLIVFRKCCHYLAEKGIEVVANIVGEVLTVQEMAGFQLFIARMDDELLKYWNAPCRTPYYKN